MSVMIDDGPRRGWVTVLMKLLPLFISTLLCYGMSSLVGQLTNYSSLVFFLPSGLVQMKSNCYADCTLAQELTGQLTWSFLKLVFLKK